MFFDSNPAIQCLAKTKVLVPTAGATWQALKMLGGALSLAAEQTYGYVLRPLAGAAKGGDSCFWITDPITVFLWFQLGPCVPQFFLAWMVHGRRLICHI